MAPAGKARSVLSIIALLCVCAGIVLQFLVMLSGSSAGGVVSKVYFLQTTTDNIPTLRNPVRWTFLALCGSSNSTSSPNVDCGETAAAPPFNPPQNLATPQGIPFQFLETSRFYWLSKAMFGMYLIAAFFALLCVATGVLAQFKITGDFKSGLSAILACFFQTLAAGLMSAWAVEGKNIFIAGEQEAAIGLYGFGFAWGAMGFFSVASVLYVLGGVVTGEGPARERRERDERAAAAALAAQPRVVVVKESVYPGKGMYD